MESLQNPILDSGKNFSTYKYEPLKDNESIRVLTLTYVAGSKIECTLSQVSLSQQVKPNQALSYVWGSQEKPHAALVRHEVSNEYLGSIPLTQNLRNAIHDLWDADGITSKVFWIDQISINQNDNDEKSHQVSAMSQIYLNAVQVITYVGPCAGLNQAQSLQSKGMELLQKLHKHFEPNYEKIAQFESLSRVMSSRHELPVLSMPTDLGELDAEPVWNWIVSICSGEWATRMWIVQEQVLNPSRNIILCGPKLLDWDQVATVSFLFSLQLLPYKHFADYWISAPLQIFNPWYIPLALHQIWHTRQQAKTAMSTLKPQMNLLAKLTSFNAAQCYDARDRIYALLACSADAVSLQINPDYNVPASEVFQKTTKAMIEQSPNLRILAGVVMQNSIEDPNWPSWSLNVPRQMQHANSFKVQLCKPHPYSSFDHEHAIRPRFNLLHREGLEESNNRPSFAEMIVRGRIVDVSKLANKAWYQGRAALLGYEDQSVFDDFHGLLLYFEKFLRTAGVTLEILAGMCRMVLADPEYELHIPNDPRPPAEQVAYLFWCLLRGWVKNLEILRDALGATEFQINEIIYQLISDVAILLKIQNWTPGDPLSSEEEDFYGYVDRNWVQAGRSLGVTESGRLYTALNEVQQGDLIAVFQCADRLFVLREIGKSQKYKLVGDVFVDGLMNGELYQGVEPNEVDYDIALI
jgi:hypothetical protein